MDIRDRLLALYQDEMARTPQPDSGAVMTRGDELKTRRRVLTMALPVAAAAMIVVGVMVFRPDAAAPPNPDGVAAANAVLSVSSGALDWERSPATLGWTQQRATSEGVIYVLSTAPGASFENFPMGNAPEAIYVSADGSNWTSHPTGGNWVHSIAASKGLLYAIGTAPGAEADSVVVQLGVSDDLGASFRTTALPAETRGPGFWDPRLAVTGEGVLAITSHTVNIDPWALLPSEALEGDVQPHIVGEGISVFPNRLMNQVDEACYMGDPETCQELIAAEATYTATWEELGLEGGPEGMNGVTRGAFYSADGASFEEIDYPFPEGWIERSTTLGDTAVVTINGMNGSTLMASKDLKTWEPVANEVDVGYILDLGMVDGEAVLVGASGDGTRPAIYRTDDIFGSWDEVDLAGLLPQDVPGSMWIQAAAVGSGGVAINMGGEAMGGEGNPVMDWIGRVLPIGSDAETTGGGINFLLVTRDLAEWTMVPSSDLGGWVDTLMYAPNGNLIAQVMGEANGRLVRNQLITTP